MKKIINDIIQLQELIEVKIQHQTMRPRNHLTGLNKSIDKMTKSLPQEVRSIFEKLHKKSQLAIVPIHDGCCAGCGMNLPVSLVYDVKAEIELQQCPNCSRIIFIYPGDAPVMTGTSTSKYAPRQSGIARYSSVDLMLPDMQATDCEGAVGELCSVMQSAGFTKDKEQLAELAMERESIVSTAMDHGIAFPHVRGIEGGGMILALGKSSEGINFNESSDEPVHIIFFMVIPTAASAFYLKLLSGLSESYQNEKNREKLLGADTPKKMWNALIQTTRKTVG